MPDVATAPVDKRDDRDIRRLVPRVLDADPPRRGVRALRRDVGVPADEHVTTGIDGPRVAVRPVSSRAARSTAQPLTRPVGSYRIIPSSSGSQAVNAPPVRSAATAHSPSTSAEQRLVAAGDSSHPGAAG